MSAVVLCAVLLAGCERRDEEHVPAAPPPPRADRPTPPSVDTTVTSTIPTNPAMTTTTATNRTLSAVARETLDKLVAAFQSADPATRENVQMAVTQLTDGRYSAAAQTLATVASQADLTPEQKAAVEEATQIAQRQAATGAINDLQNRLPLGK